MSSKIWKEVVDAKTILVTRASGGLAQKVVKLLPESAVL